MSDILMVCPKCGKNIVENNKAYGCEGWKDDPKCNVTIFKEFIGATITRNEAIALFEGKEVEKELTSKAGNTWKQKIAFNRETGKLEFVKTAGATLNTQEPNITSFECPACHKNLMRDGYKLICDCGQSFWTKFCGNELSDYQLDKIFRTGSSDGFIEGFVKKDGREFSAKLELKENENGKWSIGFDF